MKVVALLTEMRVGLHARAPALLQALLPELDFDFSIQPRLVLATTRQMMV